jgi:ATP-dependent helicase/nuclease subunit A
MPALTEQQREAVETIDKHVLVCAGAGSGKTHVLVEHYIELLKQDLDLSVGHVVAVTFTRKAAAEMRARLKARFGQLMGAAADHEERMRWSKCLAEIDSARIGTIHSLCESILKSFPIDAKIDPHFEVLTDLMQAELLSTCIEQAFREIVQHDASEQSLLFEYPVEEIKRLVSQSLKSSLQLAEAIGRFPGDDEEKLRAHILEFLTKARAMCLADLFLNPDWHEAVAHVTANSPDSDNKLMPFVLNLRECAATIARAADLHDAQAADVEYAWGALITVAGLSPGNLGGNSDLIKFLRVNLRTARDLAKEYTKRMPLSLSDEDEAALICLRAFIALAQRALTIYKAEKKAHLQLDYNDLIEFADAALEHEGSMVRRFYNDTIRAVLVDEFQDTNSVQSKLLTALAGPRAKFFFIGDDKQSIYRFQGADVATFNHWRRNFSESPEATTLSLNASFRSHPEIVQFVNVVFARLMADADPGSAHRATFERLHAARDAQPASPPSEPDQSTSEINPPSEHDQSTSEIHLPSERVEVIVFEDSSGEGWSNPGASKNIEAVAVGEWIKEKINNCQISDKSTGTSRAAKFGDFAILVQRNNDFEAIGRVLTERSIPYVMLGGRGFLERQEVFDLENLLRFISSPQDDHSLLGILRSPILAVSDDILHKLAVEEYGSRYASLWQKIQTAVRQNVGGLEALSRAALLLKRFIADSTVLPLSSLLKKIIVDTEYDLILLTLPNGRQRSRNIWKLVALAEENEQLSCGEFARDLALMREFNVKQADAPVDTSNAVKLMTIHASKGLEFPFVALPVLSTNAVNKKERLLFHREYGLAFNTQRTDEDVKPTWYQAVKVLDDDMDIAERKRLFYVAMTRARDHLALFIEGNARDNQSFRTWLVNSLDLYSREFASDSETRTVVAGNDSAHFLIRSNLQLSDSTSLLPDHELLEDGDSDSELSATDFALVADAEGQVKFVFPSPPGTPQIAGTAQLAAMPQLPESGENRLESKFAGQEVHSVASPISPTSPTSPTSNTTDPVHSNCNFDLLEAIPSRALELPSAWQGTVRVTPRNKRLVVSATTMGTYFHALMENLPPDGRPFTKDEIEDLVFAQHDIIPTAQNIAYFVDEGKRLLDLFYASELCRVFKQAKRRLHELPYAVVDDNQLLSRRPDLLIENQDGRWQLIDFKTDHFDLAEIKKQTKHHSKQLQAYVSELSALLKVRMTPHIYYAQHALLVDCPAG